MGGTGTEYLVAAWAGICGIDATAARAELEALMPRLTGVLGGPPRRIELERLSGRPGATVVRLRVAGEAARRRYVLRRYAPAGRTAAERRWLAHAAAMEAICGDVLWSSGAPAPRALSDGRATPARAPAEADPSRPAATEPARFLFVDDAGPWTLADALGVLAPAERDGLLVVAVEALEAVHRLSVAAGSALRRAARRAGASIWRWRAADRGEELGWHAGRLLTALGERPAARERARYEEGLLGLAGWAEGLAGCLCHGRFEPSNVVLGEAGLRLTLWIVDWEEAHWGLPEYDLATLDCRAPLPPEAIDRYCERRGVIRRALFDEALDRCRLIAGLEALGRDLPLTVAPGSASGELRARAATLGPRLLADRFTEPLGRLLNL